MLLLLLGSKLTKEIHPPLNEGDLVQVASQLLHFCIVLFLLFQDRGVFNLQHLGCREFLYTQLVKGFLCCFVQEDVSLMLRKKLLGIAGFTIGRPSVRI